VYDLFILALMILGISSVVVFSYKIFHSRVYPVGVVRKIPASQEDLETLAEPSVFRTQAELMSLLDKECTDEEIAQTVHLTAQKIRYYRHRIRRKLDAKQLPSDPTGKHAIYYVGLKYLRDPEDPALEDEVVEHGEALKIQARQFEAFEKRLRRLEVESVKKLQEAAEEQPQAPPVVH
jgi:hypothetical protein